MVMDKSVAFPSSADESSLADPVDATTQHGSRPNILQPRSRTISPFVQDSSRGPLGCSSGKSRLVRRNEHALSATFGALSCSATGPWESVLAKPLLSTPFGKADVVASSVSGSGKKGRTGTSVKFSPVVGGENLSSEESEAAGGVPVVLTKNFCICLMKDYNEEKSLEELRLEDYNSYRRFRPGALASTPLFGRSPVKTGIAAGHPLPGASSACPLSHSSMGPPFDFPSVRSPAPAGVIPELVPRRIRKAVRKTTAPGSSAATSSETNSVNPSVSAPVISLPASSSDSQLSAPGPVVFQPVTGVDTVVANGTVTPCKVSHVYICAMPAFSDKSMEELRLEHYLRGRLSTLSQTSDPGSIKLSRPAKDTGTRETTQFANKTQEKAKTAPSETLFECPLCLMSLKEILAANIHILALPCGHLVCHICEPMLEACPLDRKEIDREAVRRIFLTSSV